LIDDSGNALLCDFGLSRIRHEVTRTQTNIREGGRLRYLAPELLAGDESFRTTVATDIFSLSMTFLHVWSRQVPFVEFSREQKATAAIRKGRRPKRPAVHIDLTSDIEQEFWLLIVDMWAQEASSRPQSEDMQKRLEAIFRPLLELRDNVPLPRPSPAS
jgi:serine/threonine protein kinase